MSMIYLLDRCILFALNFVKIEFLSLKIVSLVKLLQSKEINFLISNVFLDFIKKAKESKFMTDEILSSIKIMIISIKYYHLSSILVSDKEIGVPLYPTCICIFCKCLKCLNPVQVTKHAKKNMP